MIDQKEYEKIAQATDLAIKQGFDRTKVEWRKSALIIIYGLCAAKEKISANEFTDLIKAMPIKTHDNRAIGGVIRIAQKFGWVGKSGEVEVSRAGHLSRIQIWRSLICGKYRVGSGIPYQSPQMDWHRSSRSFVDLGGGKYTVNGTRGKYHNVILSADGREACDCEAFRYASRATTRTCRHIELVKKHLKNELVIAAAAKQSSLYKMQIQGLAIIYSLKKGEVDVRVIADHEPLLKELNYLMVEGTAQLLKNLLRDHLKGADQKDPYFEDVGLAVLSLHQKLTKEHYGGEKQTTNQDVPGAGVSDVRPPISTSF